jgi:hypothetical protein
MSNRLDPCCNGRIAEQPGDDSGSTNIDGVLEAQLDGRQARWYDALKLEVKQFQSAVLTVTSVA